MSASPLQAAPAFAGEPADLGAGGATLPDAAETAMAVLSARAADVQFRRLVEALPAAIYTTDADGVVTYFNEACVQLSGHRPEVGRDKWCVSWKLYAPDGTFMPHHTCPMALALALGQPIRGQEVVVERPDGSRAAILPFPTPLRDEQGKMVGAVNMLVDISGRKEAEGRQRVLLNELNHRVKNNMQLLYAVLRTAERETRSGEARAALAGASRRVSAMLAAQQVLYEIDDPARFDARHFLDGVCAAVQQGLGDRIAIAIGRAEGTLTNNAGIPLALILNELLTNAAKHAAVSGRPVRVRVDLGADAEGLELCVHDDGPGFDFGLVQRRSSGLGLVVGLAGQLGGTFEVARADGARCIVRFSG